MVEVIDMAVCDRCKASCPGTMHVVGDEWLCPACFRGDPSREAREIASLQRDLEIANQQLGRLSEERMRLAIRVAELEARMRLLK